MMYGLFLSFIVALNIILSAGAPVYVPGGHLDTCSDGHHGIVAVHDVREGPLGTSSFPSISDKAGTEFAPTVWQGGVKKAEGPSCFCPDTQISVKYMGKCQCIDEHFKRSLFSNEMHWRSESWGRHKPQKTHTAPEHLSLRPCLKTDPGKQWCHYKDCFCNFGVDDLPPPEGSTDIKRSIADAPHVKCLEGTSVTCTNGSCFCTKDLPSHVSTSPERPKSITSTTGVANEICTDGTPVICEGSNCFCNPFSEFTPNVPHPVSTSTVKPSSTKSIGSTVQSAQPNAQASTTANEICTDGTPVICEGGNCFCQAFSEFEPNLPHPVSTAAVKPSSTASAKSKPPSAQPNAQASSIPNEICTDGTPVICEGGNCFCQAFSEFEPNLPHPVSTIAVKPSSTASAKFKPRSAQPNAQASSIPNEICTDGTPVICEGNNCFCQAFSEFEPNLPHPVSTSTRKPSSAVPTKSPSLSARTIGKINGRCNNDLPMICDPDHCYCPLPGRFQAHIQEFLSTNTGNPALAGSASSNHQATSPTIKPCLGEHRLVCVDGFCECFEIMPKPVLPSTFGTVTATTTASASTGTPTSNTTTPVSASGKPISPATQVPRAVRRDTKLCQVGKMLICHDSTCWCNAL